MSVPFVFLICVFFTIGSALALEPEQIYAKAAPSVVSIVAIDKDESKGTRVGSGILIAPGEVLTNCHVINGTDQIFAKRTEYSSHAVLRQRDDVHDLCRVSVYCREGFDQPVSGIVPVDHLRVGQQVYAIGAPRGLELTLSNGLISSLRRFEMGIVIQTTAPISKGSSGGGLFDVEGRLLGITTFQIVEGQNLNFAIPASWIKQPLEVVIRQSGGLSLIDRDISSAERPVNRAELMEIIARKLKKNPARYVIVLREEGVKYETMAEIMNFLQQNRVPVEIPASESLYVPCGGLIGEPKVKEESPFFADRVRESSTRSDKPQ